MIVDDNDSSLLSVAQRTALLSFLGFGNYPAPFVFIGMEEGLTETRNPSRSRICFLTAAIVAIV